MNALIGQGRRGFSRRTVLGTGTGMAAGLLAAACGATGGAGPADTSKSAKPVKLAWAIYNDPLYIEAQKQGATLYSQKHPNVSFDLNLFEDNAKLLTEWLAGAGSHVAMNYGTPLVESGRQGLVISLDKYLKTSTKEIPLDDFVPFQLEATQWPSVGRFGLPMYINVYVLYFSKALFQKKGIAPPDSTWDWQKYADGMARVSDKDQGVLGGLITNTQLGMTKVHQNAADIIDPKDDKKCTIGSPGALEALQWINDQLWKTGGWGQTSAMTAGGFKNSMAMMAGGKLATLESGTSNFATFFKSFPDAQNDWDIAPLPKGKTRAARASIDSWTIAKVTPDQDAAWEFMKYLQNAEWIDILAGVGGSQPARISMQDRYADLLKKSSPALASKNLAVMGAPLKEKYARPQAIFRKDDESWKIIKDTWDTTMVKNEQPVTDAFKEAERRVNALLAG